MDRRWLVKVFSAGLVTFPFVERAAAYEKSSEKHHKLAIHVDVNDPEVMKLALTTRATPSSSIPRRARMSRSRLSPTARACTCCATTPRR